jgi:tRNA A-37 threonylcarbamoyl transferase component Bud32
MSSLKDFDYEDIKVIGRGQYGKAHLVRHAKDQSSYIAKTIELTCLSKKERETALQEVELLRRLDHPNIVQYQDNFFMGDTLVIIMQFCEGGDLANYIKENARDKKRFQEEQIMHYFVQVLQALQYIHTMRILHRDLKTSNLFLTKMRSIVKLGDFGISRVLEGSIEAAITVVGTPYYMSPEVCENKPYTFKSDVWSLGCVLYELCMLKHAFSADNLLGLVYKIVSDKYEPIPKRYSQALNTLIQRMLTKVADQRPSVGDLLADAYVQGFMNEYVRTRGQCATPALAGSRAGASASTASGGAPGRATRTNSAGGAYAGAEPAAASGKVGGAPGRGPAGHGVRPARPKRPARSHAAGGSSASLETPKEAALRRKREAADRKAEELKAATREAATKTSVARQMKEAEFQTTKHGSVSGGMAVVANSSAPTWPGPFSNADGQLPEDIEEPLEEISEDEYSEEYEDDFEDEFYTEDDLDEVDEELEDEYLFARHAEVGLHLSTVREEQDFGRVMSNYEHDLQRAAASERAMGASPPPSAAPGTIGRMTGGATSNMAMTDVRTRASRLREELIRKMGPETFQLAFDFLVRARRDNVDERQVRRELEERVGRETYKTYCFDVDQLVFQQTCLNSHL